MKTVRTTLILVLALIICAPAAHSQGRFLNKLKEAVGGAAEDEVTDKAAEETREQTGKVLDGIFDGKSDSDTESSGQSGQTGESGSAPGYQGQDYEAINDMLGSMLGDMNKAASLPEAYVFDLQLDTRTRTGEDPWQPMSMLFDTESAVFAFAMTQDGQTSTTVIDTERDLIAIYIVRSDGSKEAMAMPNMMSMAAAFGQTDYGQSMEEEVEESLSDVSFGKTGRTKMIADHKAVEYRGESSESSGTMWVSTDLPISFAGTMKPMFEQMGKSDELPEYPGGEDGMMLEMHSVDKNDPSQTSEWETTNISRDKVTFTTSEWPFEGR